MKKFLKIFVIFLLIFLVFLYVLGSCSSSRQEPEHINYHEVTFDEYQKEMQDFIDNQASFVFNAYADDKSYTEIIKDYYKNTEFFDFDNWLTGVKELKQMYIDTNNAFKSTVNDDTNETYLVVPCTYEFYGKNLIVYGSGSTWENVEVWLSTTSAVTDGSKTGTIRVRRTNQNYSYTTFQFDISVSDISLSSSSYADVFVTFTGLSSNLAGCDSDLLSYLSATHIVSFCVSSVNTVKTFKSSSNSLLSNYVLFWNIKKSSSYYPNCYTLSSLITNDYTFSNSIDVKCSNEKCVKPLNFYYNNNANSVVNTNNINNYNDYVYNNDTNTIDVDLPSLLAYFDAELSPQLQLLFDDLFSCFPDINVDISSDDDDINYNNLIDIINQLNTTTTSTATGTYQINTADDININVTVDIATVTCDALTTDNFIVNDIDIDDIFNADLPVLSIKSSSSLIRLAFSFFSDNVELMLIVFVAIVFVFISMLFF